MTQALSSHLVRVQHGVIDPEFDELGQETEHLLLEVGGAGHRVLFQRSDDERLKQPDVGVDGWLLEAKATEQGSLRHDTDYLAFAEGGPSLKMQIF